jgi:hypothetical protein
MWGGVECELDFGKACDKARCYTFPFELHECQHNNMHGYAYSCNLQRTTYVYVLLQNENLCSTTKTIIQTWH